jgi:hypothetical protein
VHSPDLLGMTVKKERDPIYGVGIAAQDYEYEPEEYEQDGHSRKEIHGTAPSITFERA